MGFTFLVLRKGKGGRGREEVSKVQLKGRQDMMNANKQRLASPKATIYLQYKHSDGMHAHTRT